MHILSGCLIDELGVKAIFSSFKRSLIISFLLLAVLIAVIFAVLIAQNQQELRQQAAGITIRVTVNTRNPGIVIPPRFDGLGFESATACNIVSVDKQNSTLSNLFANLGPAIIRFGGNSVEDTYWSPTATSSCSHINTKVVTPSLIDGVFALAKKLHWKVIWGENLKNGDPISDADEAAYAVTSGGSSLLALEIGNEPDAYGWEYTTFESQWDIFASAIKSRTPSAPLSGPATCCRGWFTKFIHDDGSKIVLATQHLYPMGVNDSHQTIAKLLSPKLMNDTARSIKQVVSAAEAHDLPLQLDESNDISGGGTPGVSNVFASALWVANYLFTAAQQGIAGVNLFEGDGATYEPLHISGDTVSVKPLYYGMLYFHYTAGNGRLVPIQVISSPNVAAYGIVRTDGKLRVAILNKDRTNGATIQIKTTNAYTKATAIRLSAPSVTSTSGITFGGSAVASDGTWSPKTIEPVTINGATSSIFLPAASAAVITYENGNDGAYLLPDQQVQQLIRQQTLPPQLPILPLESRCRRRNATNAKV